MRLRILTDDPPDSETKGHGPYVRVENAETGELLDGVVSIMWSLTEISSVATATITLIGTHLDVDVDDWKVQWVEPKALPASIAADVPATPEQPPHDI